MNERELQRALQRALEGAAINLEWLKAKFWAATMGTLFLLFGISMLSIQLGDLFEIDWKFFILPLICLVVVFLKWIKSLIYKHLNVRIDNGSLYAIFIILMIVFSIILPFFVYAATKTSP